MNLQTLGERFREVRDHTLKLAAPLSPEDCCVQSMTDASPTKWHLGHTTWFFETFILERKERRFAPFDPAFRVLFNSYYNGVGDKHPRNQRGLLTRPSLDTVLEYRADVDRRIQLLFESVTLDAQRDALLELGLHHEQQHQELMLTDIKHLFSRSPLRPNYGAVIDGKAAPPALEWLDYEGGVAEIGHDGGGFHFDNEAPRHRVYLSPYRLASRLVTNGEFAEFIAAGGYRNPAYWLAEGWDWRCAEQREHPLYWRHDGSGWREFTLAGKQPMIGALPIVHVSYFEADAYARWADARLPTEAEWEHAAATAHAPDQFDDNNMYHPRVARGHGLAQLYGDVWQWTSSSYSPYPSFRAGPGAIGEYNGKFMVNQYVLRGGSCATPSGHARATYRNFFPATACWQFSGIRLAQDCA